MAKNSNNSEVYKIEVEIDNLTKEQYESIWAQLVVINGHSDKDIEMKGGRAECSHEETAVLPLHDVSQQRKLFYNFITWYNAKPFVKKPKDGLITTTIIEEYLKL